MATDVKRNVQIGINVTATGSDLAKLAEKFANISKTADTVTNSIKTLSTALSSINVSDNLDKVVTTLNKIKDVGPLPNVKQIAEGFERLGKFKKVPNLNEFVNELKKFKDVKVPSIINIANGLEKLSSSSVDMVAVGARLRILQRQLNQFSDIKLPSFTSLTSGISALDKINLTKTATNISTLVASLQKFSGIPIPKLTPFIKNIQELNSLDVGIPAAKLSILATSLNSFKDVKLPGITSFVNGLKELGKLRITPIIDKIKKLEIAIRQLDKSGYIKSFTKFASDLRMVGSALANVPAKADAARASIARSGDAATTAGNAFKTFGDRVKAYLSYRGIADVVMGLRDAVGSALKSIVEYSQALKDLQAITTATDDEVLQMSAAIKKTASDTKFMATEVAVGMKIMGQAGLSAGEASQAIRDVAHLATGTLSSMEASVQLTTTAMRVFNIEASESGRIVDVFANAVNKSKLTIDKIGTAFNYVGPIARSAGLSFEETNASLMSLANSGLRASTMGTGLRRILAELADPSKKFSDAASRLGVNLEKLNPETNDFSDVLSELRIVLKDTDTAFEIFGKRGAAAALALTDSTNAYDEMLSKVTESGTAAQMASTQMEGLGIAFKKVVGKAQLLMITIGESGLSGVLYVLAKSLQVVLDAMVWLSGTLAGKIIIGVTTTSAVLLILAGIIAGASIAFSLISVRIIQATTALGGFVVASSIATKQMVIARAAITRLGMSLGVIGVVLTVIISLYSVFSKRSAKIARENRNLADGYRQLGDKIKDYHRKVSDLTEGSEEYANANKALKTSLLEVAGSHGELASEALLAAQQIDPLTGKIKDSGIALKAYNDEVERLEFSKVVVAMKVQAQAIEDSAGGISGFGNQFSDGVKNAIAELKQLFDASGSQDSVLYQKIHSTVLELIALRSAIRNGVASFEKLEAIAKDAMTEPDKLSGQIWAIETYNSTIRDAAKALDLLKKRVGDQYNLSIDSSDLDELLEKYFGFEDKGSLLVQAIQFTHREAQKQTETHINAQIQKYTSEFLNLQSILNDTADKMGVTWKALNNIGDSEKLGIDKTASDLEELGRLYKEATETLRFAQQGVSKDGLFTGVVNKEFVTEQMALVDKYFEELQKKYREGYNNPEVIRAIALSKAEEKQALALANAEILTTIEGRYAAEKKALDAFNADVRKANETAAKAHINLALKQFETDKRIASEDLADARYNATIKLNKAKEDDYNISQDNARLGSDNLNVHAAKVAMKEKEKEILLDSISAYERSLAIIKEESKTLNIALSESAEYQKVLKDLKSAKFSLLQVTGQLTGLDKKEGQIKAKLSAVNEEITKSVLKRKEAELELAGILKQQSINEDPQIDTDIKRLEAFQQLQKGVHEERLAQLQADVYASIEAQEKLARIKAQESASKGGLTPEQEVAYALELARLKKLETDKTILVREEEVARAETSQQHMEETAELQLQIAENQWKAMAENPDEYLKAVEEALNTGVVSHVEAAEMNLEAVTLAWQRGIATVDDYKAAVIAAMKAGAGIDMSQQTEATKNVWKNLKFSMEEGAGATKSFNMEMQELGKEGTEALVNGLTANIHAFATGTKSAKEAFRDFAKDFLEKIAQMILKQIVLNTVKAAMGGFSSGGEVGTKANGGKIGTYADGGRIQGYSPNPTADNIPIWATAGEYMQPVAAVRKYGAAFMESIRTLRYNPANADGIKGFNMGGLISGLDMMPRLAYGGSVASVNSDGPAVNVSAGDTKLNVVNFVDQNLMGSYLDSVAGEKTMINFIAKNQGALRGILS